jgi:hypothetical protein
MIWCCLALTACSSTSAAPAPTPDSSTSTFTSTTTTTSTPEAGDYVPAEFKLGASRWKDTGLYVDGKPMGIVSFGELPATLEPVWVEQEVSVPFKAGSTGPRMKIVKQRHYRFTDYLTAVGIDVSKVKELHVYGPRFSNTTVVTGAELRKRGKDFLFRFGGDICGKAIPMLPDKFGNGNKPDKISSIMVYVHKKPPRLVRNKGLVLDGEVVSDVPYYGEPLRGGVRVYLDDRLATVIKRRQLADWTAQMIDDQPYWSLAKFLRFDKVDTSHVVEAWIIRKDQRVRKLTAEELLGATFTADTKAKGTVSLVVGGERIPTQALALHTHALDHIPAPLPTEHCTNASDN